MSEIKGGDHVQIRECSTLVEMERCVSLQREVFGLPDIELSPVRHLVVTRNAGGFTLGAYDGDRLVGFVLSVPAFLRGEKAFYSHMTAVAAEYQGNGVGSALKWAQRKRSIAEGIRYIKWTFEPIKARNAYFNLEKLGASVRDYEVNFYGVDYAAGSLDGEKIGLASDRLFAEWDLESAKVCGLAGGRAPIETREPFMRIPVVADWFALVERDPRAALAEQIAVRASFEKAFARGLIGRGFQRGEHPHYLLYDD